ncbi:leucine-rich repeat-containing protein [Pseudomonas alkylphenolica]|uniref:RING-type E3 ubiquitin transferase n=2 Tax=Pseudomonas alkylphenolica TaxID=237609 RepID=A0A077FBS1_9PSED|nr:leucine-rich repeat-containing protein [Pseudomonas alkylphenolica]
MTQSQPSAEPVAVAQKIANATDDFIQARHPAWLLRASPEQINAVRDCMQAHALTQDHLHQACAGLTSPDELAVSRLQPLLQGPLKVKAKLRELYWRELRRSFRVPPGGLLPEDTIRYVHQPALQRLMQNFEPDASFFLGTGLASSDKDPVTDQADLVSTEVDVLALFCREDDMGEDYQRHLGQAFDERTQSILAQDKRKGLALAAEIAVIKDEIVQSDLLMLRQLVAESSLPHAPGPDWRVMQFKLLGCQIDGALAVEHRDASGQVQRVMLYLPDAPGRSLFGFDSWAQLNAGLAVDLRRADIDGYFRQRVSLGQLPGFLNTLGQRLADSSPDLEPTGAIPSIDIFDSLAAHQVWRIKDDARKILVPTADADHAASRQRIEALQGVGLILVNVAGLFVPVVGGLLLAQTAVQILSQTFEGVRDWSRGHQHEALEHLLGVVETVAVGAAVAAGAQVIARGFKRSSFVDGLVPINTNEGAKRLWSDDLRVYAASDVPAQTQVLDNGLHGNGQRQWWRHDNAYYEVRQRQGRWHLQHPQREGAYAPLLQFNGERGWRLGFERPLEWQGSALLLSRLWPEAANLDAQRIGQILQVAGVDEDELRGLLVENRSMPVSLRDTLERFSVDARIEVFFTALAQSLTAQTDLEFYSWCQTQIDTAGLSAAEQRAEILDQTNYLREGLFAHFTRQYLPADDGLALLRRDFPGLPDAYALHLLQQANDADRLRMAEEQRIPLALAEQARSLLRHARLTRMREGLFLRSSYQADSIDLAFNLLRKHASWPGSINLELREGSDSGRRLAVLDPQNEDVRVMVWRGGRFWLYDNLGRPSGLEIREPAGLPEVLLAVLPDTERTRLRWTGSDAADQVERDLQRWLPTSRQQLERLLGWREVKPWFNPGQRLADGRVGYLLSGRGAGRNQAESTLRDRIRTLYVGFSENEVEDYLNMLLQSRVSAFDVLLNQEHQYQLLDAALASWETDTTQRSTHRARQAIAEELRRCWRLQGDPLRDHSGQSQGMRLSLAGSAIHELPELPVGVDFTHVSDLRLIGLQLQRLPANFLQCFSGVRWLNLSSNVLTVLPAGIERLNELRVLRLNENRIQMTQLSTQVLVNLPRLGVLNLSDNPLGSISLQTPQRSRLSELYLRNCRLRVLPSGLVGCGLLEHADLRDNQITNVPAEILRAPYSFRRALSLQGNALPRAIMTSLRAPDPLVIRPLASDMQPSRDTWTQAMDPQLQQQRGASWDRLQAEPGSQDFFQLISELSGTSDFRQAREDLGRRVWEVLDAALENTELRQELFNLAASPRTCVDSVASCFSTLEVRVFVARALQRSVPEQARAARLDMARRLFRLDQVEQIARADIQSRSAAGRGVDEIEVSLAYRSGLAHQLGLPGQPSTMQFQAVARVSDAQLADAAQAVRDAENSEALAAHISQRDFWLEYLRREYAERFSAVEQPFWDRLGELSEENEGVYLEQANQLASEREQALKTLALDLTREALAADRAGEGGN